MLVGALGNGGDAPLDGVQNLSFVTNNGRSPQPLILDDGNDGWQGQLDPSEIAMHTAITQTQHDSDQARHLCMERRLDHQIERFYFQTHSDPPPLGKDSTSV